MPYLIFKTAQVFKTPWNYLASYSRMSPVRRNAGDFLVWKPAWRKQSRRSLCLPNTVSAQKELFWSRKEKHFRTTLDFALGEGGAGRDGKSSQANVPELRNICPLVPLRLPLGYPKLDQKQLCGAKTQDLENNDSANERINKTTTAI